MPMSMRPQAHDIIRTWAFYTIVKAWMHHDKLPWENIIISGHVLSSGKDKISKSKENESITPENLLSRYSADVIRFWTASGTLGQDIAFSETQLTIGQKLITKLWNAFKFCNEHLSSPVRPDFGPIVPSLSREGGDQPQLDASNEWILHQSTECFKQYQKYFDQNEFGLALDTAEKFFWKDFCDSYLELIKDQLFNPDKYSKESVDATKWTLHHVGLRILQLYAPYLPYITEQLYEIVYQKGIGINSIHQTKYAEVQKEFNFEQSAYLMEKINNLISEVRKLKTEQQLSLKTGLQELEIYGSGVNELKSHEQLIKGITQAVNIIYKEKEIEKSEILKKDDVWIAKVKVL